MKFGRTYNVIVQGKQKVWTFGFPFTCNFSTTADGSAVPNSANFRFFNLPEDMRNDLVMDLTLNDHENRPEYRQISFFAGYKDTTPLPLVFVGNLNAAFSYRQGPDWITAMECVDGGFGIENGSFEASFAPGADWVQIMRTLIVAMPNVAIGSISSNVLISERTRGVAISGNAWDELVRRILPTGNQVFIRDEVVHVLAQNECLPFDGGLVELSPESGLIGSPRRQDTIVTFTTVFEPRLRVGQKVALLSSQPYAGDSKIMSLVHSGSISAVEAGELTTTALFYRAPNLDVVAA